MPNHFNLGRYLYTSKMNFNHCVSFFSILPLLIECSTLGHQPKGLFTKVSSSQCILYFHFYLPSPMNQTNTPIKHLNSLAVNSGISNCLEKKSDMKYYGHTS